MAGVVREGLAKLPDTDLQALATYFADLNGSARRDPETTAAAEAVALALTDKRRLVDVGRETEPGANLYLAACAACHYSPASKPPKVQASLALSSALTADDPGNFIQTVMHGVGGASSEPQSGPGPYMPGFAHALTDADIATLGAYLRRTRTDLPPWPNLAAAVAARRPSPTSIR
jgi:mono/diheme cytochrome c family protein